MTLSLTISLSLSLPRSLFLSPRYLYCFRTLLNIFQTFLQSEVVIVFIKFDSVLFSNISRLDRLNLLIVSRRRADVTSEKCNFLRSMEQIEFID